MAMFTLLWAPFDMLTIARLCRRGYIGPEPWRYLPNVKKCTEHFILHCKAWSKSRGHNRYILIELKTAPWKNIKDVRFGDKVYPNSLLKLQGGSKSVLQVSTRSRAFLSNNNLERFYLPSTASPDHLHILSGIEPDAYHEVNIVYTDLYPSCRGSPRSL